MHHEDFTFEIPHGIGVMDGISHHYPFAFSLPVEFYEVGVHGSSSVTMIRTMRSSPSAYPVAPVGTAEFGPRAAQHPLNPCLLRATRGSETAGHLAYTRRAMPAFLSIQLTHVSCGVSEIALARESPAQRPSGRILLWRTTTCSDRSPGAGSSARYGKRVPVPHPMRPHPMHTVRDIKRVCRLRKRERRPCPDATDLKLAVKTRLTVNHDPPGPVRAAGPALRPIRCEVVSHPVDVLDRDDLFTSDHADAAGPDRSHGPSLDDTAGGIEIARGGLEFAGLAYLVQLHSEGVGPQRHRRP